MKKTPITLLLAILLTISAGYTRAQNNITKEDVQNYLNNKNKDCLQYYKWAVIISEISFYDVNNDGKKEAIVVASSCNTGTAGPDIHAVFSKDSTGKIVPLAVNDTIKTFHGIPVFNNLAGQSNAYWRYDNKNKYLIEQYYDGSGRKNPLNLYFRWNGNEFDLAKMEKAPTFKTSFNCANAKTDAEITICGNKELAALDLKLDSLYTVIMSKLPENKILAFREEQREWIKKRDKECIYKGIYYRAHELYTKRIEYLRELDSTLDHNPGSKRINRN